MRRRSRQVAALAGAVLAAGTASAVAAWTIGVSPGSRGVTGSEAVPVPANVQASCGGGFHHLQITWWAVPYVQSYDVYRNDLNTGNTTYLGQTTGTSMADTPAVTDKYDYGVVARAGSWFSVGGISNQVQILNSGIGCK
jgi:fibronectin type 3 domain-containing protein